MIANKILVTAFAVNLCCKAMGISITLRAAWTCHYHRKASEDLTDSSLLQPTSHSHVAPVSVRFERSVSAMTKGMHDSLWCSLVIKVDHLLADGCVFEQIVSSRSSTEGKGGVYFDGIICGFDLAIGIYHCFFDLTELHWKLGLESRSGKKRGIPFHRRHFAQVISHSRSKAVTLLCV